MPTFFSNQTAYGQRAKLGLIVPTTNTVNEAEWHMHAPSGVTLHSARMPLHADLTTEGALEALYADVEAATRRLAGAGLSAIAYGCTAGSMLTPVTALPVRMARLAGVPCVTTAGALVSALRALGRRHIAAATPYHDALNAHEVHFLEGQGFTVHRISGLGIGGGGPHEYAHIARTPADVIAAHVKAADHPEADVMLVSCTDFPVLPLIADLEADLGKPVITSNQATLWAALRAAGIDDELPELGMLFRNERP